MGVVSGFQKNIENFSFGFNLSQEDKREWMNRSVQTFRSLGSSQAGSVAALVATTAAIFYSLKAVFNRFGYSSGPLLAERGSVKLIILDLAMLGGTVFLSDKLLSQAIGNAPTSLPLLLTLTVVCSIANTLLQLRNERNNRRGGDDDQFKRSTIVTEMDDGGKDEFADRITPRSPTTKGSPTITTKKKEGDSSGSVSRSTSASEIKEEEEHGALPNSLDDSSISGESVKNLQLIPYTPPKNFFGKGGASSLNPFSSIGNARTSSSLGIRLGFTPNSFLQSPFSPVKKMENL